MFCFFYGCFSFVVTFPINGQGLHHRPPSTLGVTYTLLWSDNFLTSSEGTDFCVGVADLGGDRRVTDVAAPRKKDFVLPHTQDCDFMQNLGCRSGHVREPPQVRQPPKHGWAERVTSPWPKKSGDLKTCTTRVVELREGRQKTDRLRTHGKCKVAFVVWKDQVAGEG